MHIIHAVEVSLDSVLLVMLPMVPAAPLPFWARFAVDVALDDPQHRHSRIGSLLTFPWATPSADLHSRSHDLVLFQPVPLSSSLHLKYNCC